MVLGVIDVFLLSKLSKPEKRAAYYSLILLAE